MAAAIERAIVVDGEATVRRVPDLAVVSLSVTIRDPKVEAARDEANARASAILARLHDLGIAETDVQASSLTLQPTYDYTRASPRVTGYEAARQFTVRVRDLGRLGPLLDAIVDDGATHVNGTRMDLADAEAAGGEALALAFSVARRRALALAESAGMGLGDTLRIEEEPGAVHIPLREMGALRATADATPTEVALGEIEIGARIRAWFALA